MFYPLWRALANRIAVQAMENPWQTGAFAEWEPPSHPLRGLRQAVGRGGPALDCADRLMATTGTQLGQRLPNGQGAVGMPGELH